MNDFLEDTKITRTLFEGSIITITVDDTNNNEDDNYLNCKRDLK